MPDLPHPEIRHLEADKTFRFNDLPKRVRDKIRVRGSRRTACWIWTGAIQPGRERLRLPRYERMYEAVEGGCRPERDAPLPQIWDGRKGAKVAAHRYIRSVLICVPIEDVPTLSRCSDPRCVSPFHNLSNGPPPARRMKQNTKELIIETEKKILEFQVEPGSGLHIYTHERCMELLRAADCGEGVSPHLSKDEAADEAGIPRDQLSKACWDQYAREEMAKENDDAD